MGEVILTTKEWIQLIVPIVSDFFISGVVLVFITKLIEGHFSSKEKKMETKKKHAREIVTEAITRLNMCFSLSIDIRYGKDTSEMAENILGLAQSIFDLHFFFMKHTDFISEFEKENKISFLLPSIEEMTRHMNNIGYVVNKKHIVEYSEISDELNSLYKLIKETLNTYNSLLAKV